MTALRKNRGNERAEGLRRAFLHWQCRMRQAAVRDSAGRPTPAMRPAVLGSDGRNLASAMTVLVHHREAAWSTSMLRYAVERTHDPGERFQHGLRILAAEHFQEPRAFTDTMTALFGSGSPTAERLLAARRVVLAFTDSGRTFRVPCHVSALRPRNPLYEATFWHNALFNPEMPPQPVS